MAKKNVVSQSKTMWVKKGDVVGGKVVKKGYVAQYGKPEKKVSATVKLVGGGTRAYKEGRAVKAPAKPMMTGGGFSPSTKTVKKSGATQKPVSYVGKPGSRKTDYQTGEGTRKRVTAPTSNMQSSAPSVNKWAAVDARYFGMRRVSAPGTFTQSYERSRGGKQTLPALAAVVDQQRREQRRIAAAKRRKG